MTKTNPPQASELELSLFGPGVGECVVLHLGEGNWAIVDSCMNRSKDKPIAQEYLESLGVDITKKIKLIVASHWHDDHIRGLSQLIRSTSSAQFACSNALRSKEFCTLVGASERMHYVKDSSGVSEFSDILEFLSERGGGRYSTGPNLWVSERMQLYQNENVEIFSLSPSSQTITDSFGGLAKNLFGKEKSLQKFPSVGPNDLSIVLLVKTKEINLLLGADLEEGRDKHRGWRAIISSKYQSSTKSQVFKVAHHGSKNADLNDIWTKLLSTKPVAVLTPYASGRKKSPSEEDIKRIKNRANKLYCTAWPPTKRPPKRENAVARTITETALTHRAKPNIPGQIRIRIPIEGPLEEMAIELFDGAVEL